MLTFESTKFSAQSDPWGYLGPYNGHESLCDFGGSRAGQGFSTSCQKLIIDWILTFAKPCLEGIPKVILSGYIKHSTKLKWEAIFEDERNGICHDMSAARYQIAHWPRDDLPPRCHCTKPCTFGPFYAILHRLDCRDNQHCSRCSAMSEERERELFDLYSFDYED